MSPAVGLINHDLPLRWLPLIRQCGSDPSDHTVGGFALQAASAALLSVFLRTVSSISPPGVIAGDDTVTDGQGDGETGLC